MNVEHLWVDNEWGKLGKAEVLGEKPAPTPPCLPQVQNGVARDLTRVLVVKGWRLI